MSLKLFYMVLSVYLLAFSNIVSVKAFHPMNVRKLYDFEYEGRFKKDDPNYPTPPDEDVLELEKLKQQKSLDNSENNSENHEDILPMLEKQLEAVAATITTEMASTTSTPSSTKNTVNQGQPEKEEHTVVQHKPPLITSHVSHDNHQNHQDIPNMSNNNEKSPGSPVKPFYGAARLAFGQNPEVITTSTTTITPLLINNASPTTILQSPEEENETKESDNSSISAELEATKNGERRSLINYKMPPKFAENLLKQKEGHYSAFDMAQYVFWTGDETGVARAVEELIQQGLMSRENAIKFLRDIRLGIEYLQNLYTNKIFPEHMKASGFMFSSPSSLASTSTTTSTTTTTTTKAPTTTTTAAASTTEKLLSLETVENSILTEKLQKAFEGIPSLFRLQEINNARKNENSIDYDDIANRIKLTEFFITESSLEEVIYQLAKVMFSQSLIHGSEQSQRALQKLTEFLETEGENGKISPELQKKVLDVLLAALSDTLAEHPELLAAARSGLGASFHKLPKSSINP